MPTGETAVAGIIVCVTLGVAGVFGWRQFRQAQRSKIAPASDEQRFQYRVARRRLVISVMLALIGLAIAAMYLSGLENSIPTITQAQEHPVPPVERTTAKIYLWCWIAILSLLMAVVIAVGIDLWDVRRHWRQALQQIRNDRRDMLAAQLPRMRDEHRRANIDPELN